MLGADLAPEGARSQFIGLWKSVTAAGSMVAPLLIGIISTRAGDLRAATTAVAVVTASGALWYASTWRARPICRRPARLKRLIGRGWPELRWGGHSLWSMIWRWQSARGHSPERASSGLVGLQA